MHLRRTALRFLSSPSSSVLSKPRSITAATPSALRIPRLSTQTAFQRRWATNEVEAQKVDENAPISELQATPQEEVENAIHSDNAAEPTEHATSQTSQPPSSEQGAVDAAIKTATETATEIAANAASTVTEAAESVRSAFTGSEQRQHPGERRIGQIGEPKPTIYIGNLFFDVTENDLVKELARFGTIVKCRLMRDSRGLSKG
jgi:nucleolin